MEDKKRKKDDKRKRETSQKVSMFPMTGALRHLTAATCSPAVQNKGVCEHLAEIWIHVRLISHFTETIRKIFSTARLFGLKKPALRLITLFSRCNYTFRSTHGDFCSITCV